MPRNLEARNFLSLLQRSPSPPPTTTPLVCSLRSVPPRSHLPFSSTSLLHARLSIFAFFVPPRSPATSSLLYLFVARIIATLGPLPVLLPLSYSLSLFLCLSAAPLPCSIGSPSLSKRTHSRINRYGRVTRVYIGGAPRGPSLITYPAVPRE